MTRTAQPYEAVTPLDIDAVHDPMIVVGTAPTMRTRNVHGDDYEKGLGVQGTHGQWIAIAPVNAAARSVSTPFVQPSTVAPDQIKVPLFVTHNYYSPVSHAEARAEFSKKIPERASWALTKLPGVNNRSRRPSGAAFTTPYPLAVGEWPTAAQWLADRMRENQV